MAFSRRTVLAGIAFGSILLGITATMALTGSTPVQGMIGTVAPLLDDTQHPGDRKVAVIVLDGADWEVIRDRWQEGGLPHLRELAEEGVAANFSTPRAFSPITWTKMATGMRKDNLSLERRWTYQTGEGMSRLDSRAIEKRRFWSYLNADGIRTGVYHWLITWPVTPVDGFMISGLLTGNLSAMTYPAALRLPPRTVRESLRGFQAFDVAHDILDTYPDMEVLALGFTVSDKIQHNFWRFLDRSGSTTQEYRDILYRPYQEIDRLVGALRPSYTVIVVSDHGFQDVPYPTYEARMNSVLREIGLTSYQNSPGTYLANDWNFDKEGSAIIHLVDRTEVLNRTHYRVRFEWMNRSVPRDTIIQRLRAVEVSDGTQFLQNVRYGGGAFFVADMYLDPERMGEPRLRRRYTHMAYARGRIPVYDRRLNVTYRNRTISIWIGPEKNGDHPPNTNGIFLAAGDAIQDTEAGTDPAIAAEDLAPLLLYLKGVPIPREMDGDVPDIITSSYQEQHPVQYADAPVTRRSNLTGSPSEQQMDRIEQRLSELGYLR